MSDSFNHQMTQFCLKERRISDFEVLEIAVRKMPRETFPAEYHVVLDKMSTILDKLDEFRHELGHMMPEQKYALLVRKNSSLENTYLFMKKKPAVQQVLLIAKNIVNEELRAEEAARLEAFRRSPVN